LKKVAPLPEACTVVAALELIAVFELLESTRTYSATGTAAIIERTASSLIVAVMLIEKRVACVVGAEFLTEYIEGLLV